MTEEELTTFVDALKRHCDPKRIAKATKMLRADRFQLFSEVGAEGLFGVIKSQTDFSLVYACRLETSGKFYCCTQNLNTCGGLRGKLCKHLLVLIVGLTQAGELESKGAIDWTIKSKKHKQVLDKDHAAETLLRYKGAEAGDVDWRPTETVPEDYFAF